MNISAQTAIHHSEGQFYEIRGHRLWVESEGSGETVMLLSGLGPAGSHVIFHPFFTDLAADLRVIYVDLHGRGRSDNPADLSVITFEEDVADIAELINQLGAGPVHVYGFSYGGLLGQALALDQPHLVRSLILANSLHSPEMWQANHQNINAELANQFPEVWERIQRLRDQGKQATDPELSEQFAVHAKLIRFYNPDNIEKLPHEPGDRNEDLYRMFAGRDIDFMIGGEITRIPDFRPRLNELAVPVLVLAGRYDRALHPRMQRQFTIHNPQIRLEFLERSGSFSHIEQPDTVLSLIKDFLCTTIHRS